MPDSAPPPGPSRLDGLNAGRVFDMILEPARRGEGREVPSAEELGSLLPEYEVHAIIGRGGMGAVYRAVQRKLARLVAIKVLPVELGDAAGFADRFRREAMTTAGLAHPDIVAVHDTGETVAGHHYYVMDLVDGEDLAQRMERGRLAVEESAALLATVCGAVEAAHAKGIVHRDIKPSNILLTQDGKPRLADFGLALLTERHLEYSRLTLGGTTLGTLEYAAPEQLAGTAATPASDQYSLGVLAYELLTGELPRGVFDPPSARNTEIDPAFDGVILRALQSDPSRRYDGVAEFRVALQTAADRRAQQAAREKALRRKIARRARVAVLFLVIAVITAGSAIYAWLAKREANDRRAAAEAAEKETEGVIQFLLTDLRQRLERTGNLDAMESVLQRAVTHFRQKYEKSGHSADAAVQLADALVVEGEVLAARGLPGEGLSLFGEALEMAEAARTVEPENPARVLRVVQGRQRRSQQHLGMGNAREALDDARRMLQDAEGIPDSSRAHAVASAHITVANALEYLQQFDECRASYQRAHEILAAELKRDPGNNTLSSELANLDMSLGSLAEEQKDYPLMLEHFTAWYEFVKSREPEDSLTRSHAAARLAHALVLNRRAEEAFPLMVEANPIAEAEVNARPGHRGSLSQLRYCFEVFGLMQDQRGDSASAAEIRRRIVALDAAIAATPEEEAAGPRDRMADRLQRAEQKLFAGLLQDPENDSAQYAWAMASEDAGKHLETSEGIPAAMRHYQRQLAKLEPRLAAALPDTWWNLGASCTLNRLGELMERTRDWAGAEPVFRRSLILRRRTLAAHSGNSREPRNVASTASRLARVFIAQDRPAEAGTLWHELLAELKPVPGSKSYEWRALVATSVQETIRALTPEAAAALASAAREFLLVHGEATLSEAERQCLRKLEKAGVK